MNCAEWCETCRFWDRDGFGPVVAPCRRQDIDIPLKPVLFGTAVKDEEHGPPTELWTFANFGCVHHEPIGGAA